MNRILLIILLFFGIAATDEAFAQSGGRKREGRAKKRGNVILNQYKSRGHADEFAKGNSGRRGRLSRLFRKDRPAWVYKSSGSARSHYKENRFLFFRYRSKGRAENAMITDRQNKKRARDREHGNETFKARKFKKRK